MICATIITLLKSKLITEIQRNQNIFSTCPETLATRYAGQPNVTVTKMSNNVLIGASSNASAKSLRVDGTNTFPKKKKKKETI